MFSRPWRHGAAPIFLLAAVALSCAGRLDAQQPRPGAMLLADALPSETLPDAPGSTQQVAPPAEGAQAQAPAQQPATGYPNNNTYDLQRAEHQRILGVMPEFQAVNNQNGQIVPLTPKEKFHLFWKSSTDGFIFGLDGIVAGIGQAKDSNPGFGQGAQGYFKRFGASYADTFDGNFWGNAVLTSALHEDPRYFRLGEGHSGFHRALYSAATAVWTRNDNGTHGPNFANILGNFISGGISNIYYPAADRGLSKTVTGAITVTAEGTVGSELIEFWPDIERKLFPKHYRQMEESAPPPAKQTP